MIIQKNTHIFTTELQQLFAFAVCFCVHVGGRDKLKSACKHRDLISLRFASASEHTAANTILHNSRSMISLRKLARIVPDNFYTQSTAKFSLLLSV